MSKNAAHNSTLETGELILGIPLVLSLILNYFMPIPLSLWIPRPITLGFGILQIIAGLQIIGNTRRQFNQENQPTDPGLPTTQLIVNGIFSWSRNPLYLAGIILFTGLAVVMDLTWYLILIIPTIIAVHYILIVPEEQYLEKKFGDTYREYVNSVHRWLGRK